MAKVNTRRNSIANFIAAAHFWVLKAGFSIADQVLISGSNFVINIMLARWLLPAEYGAFVVAFSIFLFLSGFHNALILEPMSVIGSSKQKEQLTKYLSVNVLIHGGITFGIAGILALIAILTSWKESSLSLSFWGLFLAAPFILLLWLFRRACYLKTKPNLALMGSVFYALLLLAGIFIIWKQKLLSPFNALLVMALASAGVSLAFWRYFRIRARGISFAGVKVVLAQHWEYGRWIMGVAIIYWISSQIYLPVLAAFVGFEGAAAFRAMENLLLPIGQVLTAFGILLLPWLSREAIQRRYDSLRKRAIKICIVLGCLTAAYVFFIILIGPWLTGFLYGKKDYSLFLGIIPYLGTTYIIGAIKNPGLANVLRATKHSQAIFWATAGGAIMTLTFGIFLVWRFGIQGAAIGRLISEIVQLLIILWFFEKFLGKKVLFSRECSNGGDLSFGDRGENRE